MNEKAYALTFNEFFGHRKKDDDEKTLAYHVIFSFVVAVSTADATPNSFQEVGKEIIEKLCEAKSLQAAFDYEYNGRPVHAETLARFIRTKFENGVVPHGQLQNLTISVSEDYHGQEQSAYVTL